METISKIWGFLSGKKTVIGSICLWIAGVFLPFVINDLGFNPEWFGTLNSILSWVGGILTPLGVGHKAVKKTK